MADHTPLPISALDPAAVLGGDELIPAVQGGKTVKVLANALKGQQGEQGVQGEPGAQGVPGSDGADGAPGEPGKDGADGAPGADGQDGASITAKGNIDLIANLPDNAAKGDMYFVAENGHLYVSNGTTFVDQGKVKGEDGEQGVEGPQGQPGEKGEQGIQGNVGPAGADGAPGAQGEQGPQGEPGPQGEQGVQGPQGDKGEKGDIGPRGIGINMIARLDDESQLPDAADYAQGDTFVIKGHYWTVYDGTFIDLGDMRGPQGKSTYDLWLEDGNEGTIEEFINAQKGADGIGLQIRGSFASTDDLPVSGQVNGDAYIINQQMYVWDGTEWSIVGQVGPKGDKGEKGDTGEQGLQGEKGETGAQGEQGIQGIQGEKGEKGDTGEKGDMGAGVQIMGKLASTDELPASGELGQGYLIEGSFYGWTGSAYENLGPIQGPKGDIGPQGEQGPQGEPGPQGIPGTDGTDGTNGTNGVDGADGAPGEKGDQGEPGPQGEQGLKGDTGAGLVIKGTVATVEDLPSADNTEGDAYLVGENLHVYITGAFQDMGPLRGEKGDQGEPGTAGQDGAPGEKGEKGDQGEPGPQGEPGAGLNPKTEVSTPADLPADGNTVNDMYYAAGHTYIWNGTEWVDFGSNQGPQGDKGPQGLQGSQGEKGDTGGQGIQGIQGIQGEEGPQGNSVVIRGHVATAEELPTADIEPGSVYTVGDEMLIYSWDGAAFIPAGAIRGEQGAQGEQGVQGDIGAGIKILGKKATVEELPATADAPGDGYMIGTDFYVWDGAEFVNVGPIQGPRGETGARGLTGFKGDTGEKGNKGDKGDTGTKWIVFAREPNSVDGVVGDYFLNSTNQFFYQKTSTTNWAQLGTLGGGNVFDAEHDGKPKVRQDGQWVDLAVVFDKYDLAVMDVTGTTLDISQNNCFRFSGTTDKSITFTGMPEDTRAEPVVLIVSGKGASFTWGNEILWSRGESVALGDNLTIITLLWTGTQFIGQVAMSA